MFGREIEEFVNHNRLRTADLMGYGKKVVYGNYDHKDIVLTVNVMDNVLIELISVLPKADDGNVRSDVKDKLEEEMNTLKETGIIQEYTIYNTSVEVRVANKDSVTREEIEQALNKTIEVLEAQGVMRTGCEQCGNDFAANQFLNIKGSIVVSCPSCSDKVLKEFNEYKDSVDNRKESYITGTLGAIVGGLVGALIWGIISYFGYISVIGAAAIVLGVYKGYEIGKGKKGGLAVAIVVIISLLMEIVGECFGVIISVYFNFATMFGHSGDTISLVFTFIPDFISDPEVQSAIMYNLLIGTIFIVIFGFGIFKSAAQKQQPVDKNMVNVLPFQ